MAFLMHDKPIPKPENSRQKLMRAVKEYLPRYYCHFNPNSLHCVMYSHNRLTTISHCQVTYGTVLWGIKKALETTKCFWTLVFIGVDEEGNHVNRTVDYGLKPLCEVRCLAALDAKVIKLSHKPADCRFFLVPRTVELEKEDMFEFETRAYHLGLTRKM